MLFCRVTRASSVGNSHLVHTRASHHVRKAGRNWCRTSFQHQSCRSGISHNRRAATAHTIRSAGVTSSASVRGAHSTRNPSTGDVMECQGDWLRYLVAECRTKMRSVDNCNSLPSLFGQRLMRSPPRRCSTSSRVRVLPYPSRWAPAALSSAAARTASCADKPWHHGCVHRIATCRACYHRQHREAGTRGGRGRVTRFTMCASSCVFLHSGTLVAFWVFCRVLVTTNGFA